MKMKRIATTVATVLAGAFALAACATPDATPGAAPALPGAATNGDQALAITGTPQGGALTLAISNIPNALIDTVPSAANSTILHLTHGPGFGFYDDNLNFVRNTDFGTFDLLEQTDNTMTVQFTVNEGVLWSDGTPVDAADLILFWAGWNDRFDHIALDADGEPVAGAASINMTSVPMTTVSQFPLISADGRSITFTFDAIRSDWYLTFDVSMVPAHIVARRALGIQDAETAKQALISAFGGPADFRSQDGTETPAVTNVFNEGLTDGAVVTFTTPDSDALALIAESLNNDWSLSATPDDLDLAISRGPFRLVEWVEGEFLRLERNPNFTAYGSVVTVPHVDEITVRFIGDPMAAVMALQNGEVDIIAPQTSVDTVAAVQALTTVNYSDASIGVYEHVTLMLNAGGPFDPTFWGGDAELAQQVRLAFLYTLPRQEIIDFLIRPLQDDASLRNSWTTVPGAPAYAAITAGNDSAVYNVQDLELARQILVDAGLEYQLPLPVRFLYANNNVRRSNQFELIQAAAPDLFNVIDTGSPDWGAILGSRDGSFDAALFGWASTSTSPNNSESTFVTGGNNNHGGFSDATVDALWAEITTTTDEARVTELTTQMEQILFSSGFGSTLFQHPGLVAWGANIGNVNPIAIGVREAWNFWEWYVTAN